MYDYNVPNCGSATGAALIRATIDTNNNGAS